MSDDLDSSLDEVVQQLRRYVEVARGVRAEFDPEQADLDPRVEEAGIALGLSLGRLEDRFSDEVGFVPTIEPMWRGDDDAVEEAAPDEDGREPLSADAFSLGLVVGVEGDTSPDQLDGVLALLDDAAAAVVDRLESRGYVVPQYYVARGDHSGFVDDDELDDVDDGTEEP